MNEEIDNGISGFKYFRSYYETGRFLEDDRRLRLQDNILAFMFCDKEPQGEAIDLALFAAIRPHLQKSKNNIKSGRKGGEANRKQPEAEQEQSEIEANPKRIESEIEANPKATRSNKNKNKKEKKNIEISIKEKKSEKAYFPNDEELDEAFRGYVDFRKEIKKTMTDRAIELAIEKLNNLSGGDNRKAIQIVNQSVINGWLGLFPLKDNGSRESKKEDPSKKSLNGKNFPERERTKEEWDSLEVKLLQQGG